MKKYKIIGLTIWTIANILLIKRLMLALTSAITNTSILRKI